MQQVDLPELHRHLHDLVDQLAAATVAEQGRILVLLRRRARLYAQAKEYLAEAAGHPAPAPAPQSAAAPEPAEAPTYLEGPFIRLRRGGKIIHPGGEHTVTECAVMTQHLQHAAVVRAVPDSPDENGQARYTYEVRPQPAAVVEELAWPGAREGDLVEVRTQQNETVVVSLRDMEEWGASGDHVLTVAFSRAVSYGGRYLGRVVKVHPTGQALPPLPKPERVRRKRPEPEGRPSPPGRAPGQRFEPSGDRPPVIVLVGGHPQSRARYEEMVAGYGAVLRSIPYSPKIRDLRRAVEASDIVIAFPSCCRTGQWKTALDRARTKNRLFFYGGSENESGLRTQLEQEVIPQWNSHCAGSADSA